MTETGAPGVSPKKAADRWCDKQLRCSRSRPICAGGPAHLPPHSANPHPKNRIYASLALPWARLHRPRLWTGEPPPAARSKALTFLNPPDSLSLIISPQALKVESELIYINFKQFKYERPFL
ncbi:hypothetical protein mRhiFer1_009878 [Rhinolophus ferrumequinum]|uniref:Uncharacterized protein n=1 Tax=Rhinolophus ferrumequinum TaxID=59479 RepID=A0A7J7YRV3_RHIFE|nr:hypothetical protein mRhiFer1_009878 [Rhinolophus ferrumequinum]